MITFSLRRRIDFLLRALENGHEIELKSGHKLAKPENHDEFGFVATRTSDGEEPVEMIFQIGSDVAWMSLIQHAKTMAHEEFLSMAFSQALTEIHRKDRAKR